MSDLEDRLRGVDLVPAPDRWEEIQERSRRSGPRRPERRLLTALVAFAVAVTAIGGVMAAFRGAHGRVTAGALPANGVIVYVDKGPQPDSIPFTNYDLFAFDPSTGARVNLTNTPTVAEESPVWSPDGSKVVFERTTATGAGPDLSIKDQLVVASADLSNQRPIGDCTNSCPLDIAWSPDQTQLVWTSERRISDGGFVDALMSYNFTAQAWSVVCDSRTCGNPGQPAWSPKGNTIAFSDSGVYRQIGPMIPSGPIWLADLAIGAVTPITEGTGACGIGQNDKCTFDTWPTWSPDGTSIAFVRTTQGGLPDATTDVLAMDPDGTNQRILTTCASNDQCSDGPPVWSPDGSSIAFVDRYDHPTLHLLDPSGGDNEIPLPPSVGEYPSSFQWSPDGSELAFLGGGRQSDLYLVDPATQEVRDAADGLTAEGELAWLPAGAIDLSTVSTPATMTTTPSHSTPIPSGTIVFASSNGSNQEDDGEEIWRIEADGSGLEQLTNNQTFDGSPALSPDGTQIAFRSYRSGDRNTEIYVMNVDGSDQHVVTDLRTGAGPPAWSPDGTKIAFESSAGYGDPGGIFVMNADGSDQHLVAEGNASDPTWSNNGYYLAYALNTPEGQTHLQLIDWTKSADKVQLPVLPGEQDEPALSPDGQIIAFHWTTSAGDAIYTMHLDESDLTKISEGSDPAWSPDGKWLAFTHTDEENGSQIWAAAVDGSGVVPLTSMRGFIQGTKIYGITREPSWGPAVG